MVEGGNTPLLAPGRRELQAPVSLHGERGRRRSEPRAEMVGPVLKPAHERFSVSETGREVAAWAGQGGAKELSEAEAQAGGAGKGAGPEEGETLKRKQQQFGLL